MKLQQLLLASKACQVNVGLSCPCNETHVLPARRRPRKGLALQQMMAAKRQHQAEQQHLNPLLLQYAGQKAGPAGSSQPQSSAGGSPEASGEGLAVVNPLYSNTSGYSTSGSLYEGKCEPSPKGCKERQGPCIVTSGVGGSVPICQSHPHTPCMTYSAVTQLVYIGQKVTAPAVQVRAATP